MSVVELPSSLHRTRAGEARPAGVTSRDTPRAVITGTGLVTPLGADASASWRALLAGQFIENHAVAQVNANAGACRVSALARRAAAEAVAAHGGNLAGADTAVVVGTSKGPVEQWVDMVWAGGDRGLQPPATLSDLEGPSFGLSAIARAVAGDHRVTGPRLTLSAACASGLHALIRGAMLIHSRQARHVLVVAAEASVHPLFLGSFKRLGVLPREGFGCRPFDVDRDGFLMSEAAAAVVLSADDDDESGADVSEDRPDGPTRPLAVVERFAMGGDASHLTASDPEHAVLRRLISDVIHDEPVDLVHAHGTGTPTNDAAELAAIESVVPPTPTLPNVYSHKGALGHSLGAAGLVSVVINCLAHVHDVVPPNVRTERPLPTRHVRLCREAVQRPIRRSIAVVAGFGGSMAVVSLVSP